MESCCTGSIIYCGQIFEYLVEIGHIWLKIFENSPYSGRHSLSNNPAMLAIAACFLRTILCHLAIVGSKSYEGDEQESKPIWMEEENCLFLGSFVDLSVAKL